jgi:oxygen-independent coproporphyrinogen III oxidase
LDTISDCKNIIGNISIDIIYSLPNQKVTDLSEILNMIKTKDINHISAYTLIIEKETILMRDVLRNRIIKNSDDLENDLYIFLSNELIKSGYLHYEISNYAKPGFESKHNLKYWEYCNYLAFGPSGHSFFNGIRWNNPKNIIKYIKRLSKDELPIENIHKLSSEEKEFEFIMLGLRSMGIDLEYFKKISGTDFDIKYRKQIDQLIENQFGIIEKKLFRLTLKGYSMLDEILLNYFHY